MLAHIFETAFFARVDAGVWSIICVALLVAGICWAGSVTDRLPDRTMGHKDGGEGG